MSVFVFKLLICKTLVNGVPRQIRLNELIVCKLTCFL